MKQRELEYSAWEDRKWWAKAAFIACVAVLALALPLASCDGDPTPTATPTPTQSPIPTPSSPLPTPRADAGALVVETSNKMEETNTMNAELLGGLAGVVLSLLFAYIPGIRDRYDPLPNAKKQAIMGALIVLAALGAFGASCAGIVDIGVTCDKVGAIGLLGVLFTTLIGNQAMFPLTKRDKGAK